MVEQKTDAERIEELETKLADCEQDLKNREQELERAEQFGETAERERGQAEDRADLADEKVREIESLVRPLVSALSSQLGSPDAFTCAESRRLLAQCENAGYLPRPVSFPSVWGSAR